MGRSRRGVRFPHKNANGQTSGSDGRRSSFSDMSEDGESARTKAQATLETVSEVRFSLKKRVKAVGRLVREC